MKIALIGYGKMGKMIEQIALSRGHEIVSVIDIDNQKTLSEVPLAASGIDMEPYACMKYKGQIIFPSADGCLYTLYFQ